MAASSDSLFTLEVVRDFMIANGGKVRNHDLVNHFKNILNDPVRKTENRQKFKYFVNTLAAVKLDTTGEKLLTLKKKYRDAGSFGSDPTPAPTAASLAVNNDEISKKEKSSEVDKTTKNEEMANKKSDSIENLIEEVVEFDEKEDYVIVSNVESNQELEEKKVEDKFVSPSKDETALKMKTTEDAIIPEHLPVISVDETKLQEVCKSSTVKDLKNQNDEMDGGPLKSPIIFETPKSTGSVEEEETNSGVISVKEAARNLNKIEMENINRPLMPKSKREARERKSALADDGSSDYGVTLTEVDRDWILKAANCDYFAMTKILQSNPQLAKKRDFISGYTPLHWAAKHGKGEIVKLLCGEYKVPVNVRSQGGYTALHLAAMHNHEDVVHLLVTVYYADNNIRDYSGKKAKQYLNKSSSNTVHQILQPRRSGIGNVPVAESPVNPAFGKMMILGMNVVGVKASFNGKENLAASPLASSLELKPNAQDDYELMPPPRDLPAVVRRKPTTRQKEVHSDSEMSTNEKEPELHGSDSSPNVGTLV